MTLFRSKQGREPVVVETVVPLAEPDVTLEQARMVLAVSVVDEALAGERSGPRLTNALLEVRQALAPGRKPLDPPVPVVPGRSDHA